ncbi:hypothetical protein [Streptomyces sp. NPDC088348]|uniref:hypothetical protein n=1 Tax=Streptomyces sp. NPDC088348 TaxID=3365853 RepID=UPI003813BA88
MSDLKKESVSLHKAAAKLAKVSHHTAKPIVEFTAASKDLSAFGAPGSLMSITGDIHDGMETLAKLTKGLDEEWKGEAKFLGDVSDAFDLLDALLAAAAPKKKG